MMGKTAFTPEEWELILERPPGADTILVMADRGGTFRESFSMAGAQGDGR